MTDIVNQFFRRHYPSDWSAAWEMRHIGDSAGREYNGAEREKRIFPQMVCADGFRMSVQGHFGAYSHPRDDFAESYSAVEIMCNREERFEELGRGYDIGEERIYPYVPIEVVAEVVAKHGGLVEPLSQESNHHD